METKTYTVKLKSMAGSELMLGTHVEEEKGPNETHEQFEQRTWKHKIRVNKLGEVVLNQFAIKNALESAASRLKRKVPGEGRSTFAKLFRQGVMLATMPLLTSHDGKVYSRDDFEGRSLFCPSDGVRGSGKRVSRIFPTVEEWSCTVTIVVIDPKITHDVLSEHLTQAGIFIGLGSMRVENGGVNGRFLVESMS